MLLQKDCKTPIIDTYITTDNSTYSLNFTYDSSWFLYTLDPITIRDSDIFDDTTSRIEVCHVVRLTNNTNVVDKRIITINVPAEGE